MENSSIQPRDILMDYASVQEQVQELSDSDFDVLSDAVVYYLFSAKPAVHSIAPHFAQFFRHAAERSPAIAKDIAAIKMAAYTSDHGEHYDEKHEEYLLGLSKELHRNVDYQTAFDLISKATRSGALPPSTVPEVATPKN